MNMIRFAVPHKWFTGTPSYCIYDSRVLAVNSLARPSTLPIFRGSSNLEAFSYPTVVGPISTQFAQIAESKGATL